MTLKRYISTYPFQDRRRAIVKTLIYRTGMILITILVALAVTGEPAEALNIGLVANVIKTGTYYGYERIWDRINWGLATGGS